MATLDLAEGVDELWILTWGASVTAFCNGGRGSELAVLNVGGGVGGPAFHFGNMRLYNVPATGYAGTIFGDAFTDENGDPVGNPIAAQGNGRDGFTELGCGIDALLDLIPDGVTVHKVDYALGGSSITNWYNDVPDPVDYEADIESYLDLPSSDWLGYRSVETNKTIGRQLYDLTQAGKNVIVVGGGDPIGNEILPLIYNVSGPLQSNTTYWDAAFDDWRAKTLAVFDYLSACAGGVPTSGVAPNCEFVVPGLPNFNVCGDGDDAEEITEYFPQTDIDGSTPGARRAMWSMDQIGMYREFYRDALEAALPHPSNSHPNYRVGPVNSPYKRGPIPLVDQKDDTKCPAARYHLADQWYLDRAHNNRFGFDVINVGDQVNRGLATWTINASAATVPPTTALFSGAEWKYTSLWGPHGTEGEDGYAPKVVNAWVIAARKVHENVVNALFRRIGDQLSAIEDQLAVRYGDTSILQWVDTTTAHAVDTRHDVDAENKPWSQDDFFDTIHLNKQGALKWMTHTWESMAPRSKYFAATVPEPWHSPTSAAPGGGWMIYTGDANLVRTGQLTNLIHATFVDRHAKTPSFLVEVPPDSRDAELLNAADRIELVSYETSRTFVSGPIRKLTRTRQLNEGEDTSTAIYSGAGDMCWLDWRLASPQPSRQAPPYAIDAYDVRSGYASTVIADYVRANAGPAAKRRSVPKLVVLDPEVGGNRITGRARWQPLGALVASLATEGLVTYRVVQVGNELVFSCRPIRDVSDAVVFAPAINNLDSWTFEWEAATATHAVVGGLGEGVNRTIVEVSAEGAEKRIEMFVHKPDTNDELELFTAGEAELAERSERQSLTAVPSSIAGLGDTWGVGDLTTVTIDGVRTESQITEVTLDITPDLVKPTVTIGPPAEAELAAIYKTLRRIDGRTRTLERT